MVGVLGFEPRTSSLSGTRSNQLSYTPIEAKPRWAFLSTGASTMQSGPACGGKLFPHTPISYDLAANALSCNSSAPAAAAPLGPYLSAFRPPTPQRPSSTDYGGGPSLRCVRLRRVRSLLLISFEMSSSLTSATRRLPRFFRAAGIRYREVVEAKGLEPSTSCLQSRCSSH